MYFLTVNAGSSSIRFCLFDAATLAPDYSGTLSGIGFESARFTITDPSGNKTEKELSVADASVAVGILQEWITQNISTESLAAIGHRVVHGGPLYHESVIIDAQAVSRLRSIVPLDPEHLPAQIEMIERLQREFPRVIHIACFDTAFFHDLPVESRLLPLPRHYADEGIRRYGFHGLSYRYLLQAFEDVAGHEAAQGKVIIAHLGNGASLAALKLGRPIDTSMGLTPAGGIPMSSRSGDLDPGVLTYLATLKHMSAEQLSHMVGFESGLLGISEKTSDMKELLDLEAEDPHAKEAIDIFCYHVRKYIGAYAAALGGLNSLVFSGGIGEVSAPIRARICEGLEFLGVSLDESRNRTNQERISRDGAGVGVHVLASNEALMIAQEMKQLIPQ